MSRHCDCQRKTGLFVGMMYNFQPSCGHQPICGNDVYFQLSCGENSPICGNSLEILSPFVGSACLWESAPFVVLTLFVGYSICNFMDVVVNKYTRNTTGPSTSRTWLSQTNWGLNPLRMMVIFSDICLIKLSGHISSYKKWEWTLIREGAFIRINTVYKINLKKLIEKSKTLKKNMNNISFWVSAIFLSDL